MCTSLRQNAAPERPGAPLQGVAQCNPLLEVVRVMESPHNVRFSAYKESARSDS